MAVTRDEIRFGFLYVLGREPESEHVYEHFANQSDVLSFRHALLSSREGQEKIRSFLRFSVTHPYLDSNRSSVCFIHLEKTGGTTLQGILEKQFEPGRLSPSHLSMNSLFSRSIAEISNYDLISGHFDYAATLSLPRRNIKRLAIFRDPIERLISFYRFHRAHPVSKRPLDFVALAQDLKPEEFFQHKQVLCSPRLNNVYLRTFGTCLSLPLSEEADKKELAVAFDLATTRIQSLDAIGITERMTESVALVCYALGLAAPYEIRSTHRTDDFVGQAQGFTRPEPVERSDALEAVIAPLVNMDLKLYEIAQKTFFDRLSAIN
jgi:hypothetical protein